MLLRARVVLPLTQPPILDGAVRVAGNRIAAIGRRRDFPARAQKDIVDLGNVVLLPGLVNAHCHLDYTDMAGEFPPPKRFSEWIKLINIAKAQWDYSDYAASWLGGAHMLVRTGTTTVGDIEAVPELLPEVWNSTPLRVLSFLEMIVITKRRTPGAILQETVERVRNLGASRCRAGLSPHAPYSTVPELVRLSARAARRNRWRLCTHVAESAQEFEMFRHARGEMFAWLKRSTRDMSDCGLGSPVQHLARCGELGENLLAVHANYLGPGDADLLAKHKVSVAHCPRSHSYFGHGPFRLSRLARAGVNVCLGTDSLASVVKPPRQTVELNMFEEMGLLSEAKGSPAPQNIVRMATLNGARALGMQGRVGELSKGAFADLIAIPFAGKVADIYDAIVHHAGGIAGSMIDGQWAVPPQATSKSERL